MANFNFSLGFDVEKEGLSKAKQEIDKLKRELTNNPAKFNLNTDGLKDALNQVNAFERALGKAFNQDLNKLNTKDFMKSMHSAGYSVEELKESFKMMGVNGEGAFKKIDANLRSTGLSLKKTSKLVDGLTETFANTVKWNLASQAIHSIEGSVGRAIGFVKDLDESLNNIRIVTGKGSKEMESFARQANEAAKALGKTTVEYTDASLIYFQQGKNASEVRKLTEATLLASNVTGESVSNTAELLTSALNGYSLAASDALSITDKFAAVGAATGSDFNELAIGFSKVASMASVAGVSVDQLNAILATTSTVTREAPESIGTSYKTIFGRMTDLKAGKADEDGWQMGQVEGALNKAGFSMIDEETNTLREVGTVMEEIGEKWQTLSKETQLGVSVAMAGSRQQNRLIALFNNWQMYKDALVESQEAEGTTYEQNIIRMDSIEYKAKQLRASLEEAWVNIIDSDVIKGALDGFTSLVEMANNFTDAIGGIGPMLLSIAAIMGKVFSNKISQAVTGLSINHELKKGVKEQDKTLFQGKSETGENLSKEEILSAKRLKEEYQIRLYLTQEEQKSYKEAKRKVELQEKKVKAMNEEYEIHRKMIGDQGKWKSVEDRDLTLINNEATLANDKKALKEIQLLRDKKISIKEVSEATLTQLSVDRQALAGMAKTENQLDEILIVRTKENEVLKVQNELIRKNQKINTDAHYKKVQQANSDASNVKDNDGLKVMNDLSSKAGKTAKLQSSLNTVAALTLGVTTFISSAKAFSEAGDDVEKKSDAIAIGLSGIGSSLMMTGNLYLMVAGGVVSALSVIGKFVYENVGLNKIMKDNKKLIEETTETITNSKNRLKDLSSTTESYTKIMQLMKNGQVDISTLNKEQKDTYNDLANTIAGVAPELVKYYDEEGNAVIDLAKDYDALKEAQREQIRVANQAKMANVENFAKESSSKISSSKKKLDKAQDRMEVISGGEESIAKFNKDNSHTGADGMLYQTDSISADETKDLLITIQEQQAKLQDQSQEISANIVEPVFASSKAYSELTDKQKDTVRGLLDVEKATELIHDPARIEAYANGITKLMDGINVKGLESEKALALSKNAPEEERKALEVEYNERIALMTKVSESMANMTNFQKESTLETISLLELEGAEYEKALGKMTEYYESGKGLRNGPMSVSTLEELSGVTFSDAPEVGTSESRMADLNEVNEDYQDTRDTRNDAMGGIAQAVGSSLVTGLPENTAEFIEHSIALESVNDKYKEQKDLLIETGLAVADAGALETILNEQYWDKVEALGETVEGYNELADAYNHNLEVLDLMNESVGENGELTQEEMDKVAESLEAYKDMYPGLSDALQDYTDGGQDSFGNLKQYMEAASSEMAQSQGRMYASMNQDDTKYYSELLNKNTDAFQRIWELYGINAYNYKTYAEYEDALEEAKKKGKISKSQQAYNATMKISENRLDGETQLTEQGLMNDLKAGNKKISIWGIVSNQQISATEKAVLATKRLWDGVTSFFAGLANGVAGVWNGMVDMVESGATSLLKGVNFILDKIGMKTIEVSFGGAKFNKSFSGTNSAGNYAMELAEKYNEEQIDMDWNLGSGAIDKKDVPSPGGITNFDSPTDGAGVSSGGDSGGGSDSSAKEQEDMEHKLDYLHDTNVLLQKQEDLLTDLKREEETLYGKAKFDNLTKQNEALERKKSILKEQLALIKEQEAIMKKSLSGQGVGFNADGSVANYNNIVQAKMNSANSIGDPEAKKQAQEAVKEFIKELEEYETLNLKTKVSKEDAIEDLHKLQREIYLEQFEFTIKVKLELAEDQENLLAFLNEINDKFEDISDTYSNTQKELNLSLAKMAEVQSHINDITKDTTLSDKERIELLSEYEDTLMDVTKEAAKLRKELVKINETAIKDGLDLLDNQLDKYENIGKELDHIVSMLKLTGQGDNYSAIDEVFETQQKALRAQLDAQLKIKASLEDYVSQLDKGSEEWEYANDQLEKLEQQINKITEETLKSFQDEFKNSFTGIVDTLDKELSGGLGLDKLKDELKDLQEEQEKYLSLQEKIIWSGEMQQKIQDRIDSSSNEKEKSLLQEFMDNELKSLKEKDSLTENDVKRAELLYNLTIKQIALDEARNNKTIQRLVRDSSGNWSYQYVEDTKKVAQAQSDLSNEINGLMEHDTKALEDQQAQMLELKAEYLKKVEEIVNAALNGEYETQEAFYAALEGAERDFNEEMLLLETEYSDLTKNVSESTMAAILHTYANTKDSLGILTLEQEEALRALGETIGLEWGEISNLISTLNAGNAEDFKTNFAAVVGSSGDELFNALKADYGNISSEWSNTVTSMITENDNLSSNVSKATEGIKTKWQEYNGKVEEVKTATNKELQDMIDKISSLDGDVDALNGSMKDIIGTIKSEWSAVGDLVGAYQNLSKEYDSLIKKSTDYITKLNEQIRVQKEVATGVKTPSSSNPAPGSGSGSGSGSKAPTPAPAPKPAPAPAKPANPGKDSKIKVKSGRTWYYDSYGTSPSGKTDNYSSKDLYVVNTSSNKLKYAVGSQKGNVGSALGWLNLSDIQGFRTGGYTGDWGNDGKLAMLHEKEMVLNKEDTKNILDVVKIVRDYASMLKQNFGNIAASVIGSQGEIKQNITINAEFPGVSSSFEIEKAFENIENRASQYALQRK